MVLPTADNDDCDACVAPRPQTPLHTTISALPFLLTFVIVASIVSQKLFPLLSGHVRSSKAQHDGTTRLPSITSRDKPPSSVLRYFRLDARTLANLIFSTNIALSAVLAELIFCEITNIVDRGTRTLALRITLPVLLFLLIVATPAFEIHSVVSGTGWTAGGEARKSRRRIAWVLEVCGLGLWLAAFWYLGRGLLGTYLREESYLHAHTFSEGCLERIGIIGISLMASLAGFAAISSLWQTFGVKYRPVSPCYHSTHLEKY